MPYSIFYENSAGEILRFDEAPIVVQTSSLFDHQWQLTAYDRALRDGGRAVHARRSIQDKTLVLDVFADTQDEHNAALNRLHDILDYDVCALSPGKIWINDQYIRCFAHTSVKTLDRDWTTYTVVGLTLMAVSPAWTAEERVTLLPASGGGGSDKKRYPGRYPYQYSEGGNVGRWVNLTASPAPMVIKIFGPCSAPSVYVAGNEYAITGTLAAGEYAVIDQRDKTVTRVAANGTKTNIFGQRKKSADVFQYAPPGCVTVACSGLFPVEVTFLTQRSEPRWN